MVAGYLVQFIKMDSYDINFVSGRIANWINGGVTNGLCASIFAELVSMESYHHRSNIIGFFKNVSRRIPGEFAKIVSMIEHVIRKSTKINNKMTFYRNFVRKMLVTRTLSQYTCGNLQVFISRGSCCRR
jgi:hypothetical protein